MLNRCEFIGHLGADPETRRLQSGKPVVNMRLAVSEKWRGADGERKEKTEWISLVVFSEGLCKVAESYLRKGSKIFVAGQMQTRRWQDQSGQDKYSTEIILQGFDSKLVMLDGPSDGGGRQTSERAGTSYDRDDERTHGADDLDTDTIPF